MATFGGKVEAPCLGVVAGRISYHAGREDTPRSFAPEGGGTTMHNSPAGAPSAVAGRRSAVSIVVQLEAPGASPPAVEYRWDPDTDILTARLQVGGDGTGSSGSVELEGSDGSWLILDVARGRISGIEVAVWPDVQKRSTLTPPAAVEDAQVLISLPPSAPGTASVEIDTPLRAEADDGERVIHFRVGTKREVRIVRFGRDLLLALDPQSHIAGLWLLNVPPFPTI